MGKGLLHWAWLGIARPLEERTDLTGHPAVGHIPGQQQGQPGPGPLRRPHWSLLLGSEGKGRCSRPWQKGTLKFSLSPHCSSPPVTFGLHHCTPAKSRAEAAPDTLPTRAPALPPAQPGTKQRAAVHSCRAGGPSEGRGRLSVSPSGRTDRETKLPAPADQHRAENPPRWKHSRLNTQGAAAPAPDAASSASPTARVPAAPAPLAEERTGTATIPGARYAHQV